MALSGGKDSLAAYTLAVEARPGLPIIWSDGEIVWDIIPDFLIDTAERHGSPITLRTSYGMHDTWFRPWEWPPFWRAPHPGTVHTTEGTAEFAARLGFTGSVTGVRADEAPYRRVHVRRRGTGYTRDDGQTILQPLAHWTVADVWAFIADRQLDYLPIYDAMTVARVPREEQRIGCLVLSHRWILEAVDPGLVRRLEARYGHRWS